MNVLLKDNREQSSLAPRLAEIKVVHSSTPQLEKNMTSPRGKEPLMKRLMRWIVPDQRVANRHGMPPVVAYLGHIRASKIYKIADISIAGFYMVTEERWIHGTGFPVTLERTDEGVAGERLTVHCTVVRTGEDGVGFTFLQPAEDETPTDEVHGTTRMDLTGLAQFLKGLPLSDPGSDPLERAS